MNNLLRGELYKLRKSNCLYICCVIMAVFPIFLYGMLTLADKIQRQEIQSDTFVVEINETYEEETGAESIWEGINVMDMEQQTFVNFGAIMLAIFVSVFVIGEYGNGAIKNVAGKGYHRWKIFAAKYISTVIGTSLMLLVMAVVGLICWIAFRGTNELSGEIYRQLCGYVGMQILFGAAIAGIFIALNEACRNMGIGISAGIGIACLTSLLASGLDLLLHRWDVRVSDYWITSLIENCPTSGMENSFVIRAAVASVLWIVISLGIGILHFQKADIK